MGIGLMFLEEILAAVRARLLSGWILLDGPLESTARLEEKIYTPGTKANEGYELILGTTASGQLLPIHLIQKTAALQDFLERGGNTPKEFEDLVQLELGPIVEGQIPCMLTGLKEAKLEDWVDGVVASIDMVFGGATG